MSNLTLCQLLNSSHNDPTNENVINYFRPHRSINLPCRLRDYVVVGLTRLTCYFSLLYYLCIIIVN